MESPGSYAPDSFPTDSTTVTTAFQSRSRETGSEPPAQASKWPGAGNIHTPGISLLESELQRPIPDVRGGKWPGRCRIPVWVLPSGRFACTDPHSRQQFLNFWITHPRKYFGGSFGGDRFLLPDEAQPRLASDRHPSTCSNNPHFGGVACSVVSCTSLTNWVG